MSDIPADIPSAENLALLVDHAVQRGEKRVVLGLLEKHPDVLSDEEILIELIYREFVALEELGQLDRDAFLADYSEWQPRLERVLAIHEMMDDTSIGHEASLRTRLSEVDEVKPESLHLSNNERFEILERLGRGSVGTVYRAKDRQLHRMVALKIIRLDADDTMRSRFLREASAIARIEHRHILKIFDMQESDELAYLALEFVDGGSLADRLAEGPFGEREAAELLAKIADALHAAHQVGVIHRDLKPANILLTSSGEPRVADFGLAKHLHPEFEDQTQSGAVLGTPAYMAPEQARGDVNSTGPPTDVYSLGVVLFQMITGQPPFAADSVFQMMQHIVHDPPPMPRKIRKDLSVDLETIVLKCLNKNPRERYSTAALLAEDLRRFTSGMPVTARRSTSLEKAIKMCKRQPVVAAMGLVIVLLLAGLAAAYAFSHSLVTQSDEIASRHKDEIEEAVEAKRRAEEQKKEADAEKLQLSKKRLKELRSQFDRLRTIVRDAQFRLGRDFAQVQLIEQVEATLLPLTRHPEVSQEDLLGIVDACYLAGRALRITGRWSGAETNLRLGLKTLERIETAEDPVVLRSRAEMLVELGECLESLKKWREAERQFADAAQIAARLHEKHEEFVFDKLILGHALLGQARIARRDGRFPDAEMLAERVLKDCMIPRKTKQGKLPPAHEEWGRDLAERRRIVSEPSTSKALQAFQFALRTSVSIKNLLLEAKDEQILLATAQEDKSLAVRRLAEAKQHIVPGDHTKRTGKMLNYPMAEHASTVAAIYEQSGEKEKQIATLRKVVDHYLACGTNPLDYRIQRGLAAAYAELGRLHELLGQRTDAIEAYDRSLMITFKVVGNFPEQRAGNRGLHVARAKRLQRLYHLENNVKKELSVATRLYNDVVRINFMANDERRRMVLAACHDMIILRAVVNSKTANPSTDKLLEVVRRLEPESLRFMKCTAAHQYLKADYQSCYDSAIKGLKANPEDLELRLWRIISAFHLGQRSQALAWWRAIQPELAEASPDSYVPQLSQLARTVVSKK